jgi:hypothetical protein
MRKPIFALILTGLLFSTMGCMKYDEGPLVSLRTKKGRLDGKWTVSLIYNNHEDVTKFYPADYGYEFDKNGTFKKIFNQVEVMGTWEFNDDKSSILLTMTNSPDADVYEILRLTNKHLWWRRVVGGDELEEHFEVKK